MSEGNETKKQVFTSLAQQGLLTRKNVKAIFKVDPSLRKNVQFMAAVKNLKGPKGRTSLMHAAKIGDIERLEELVRFGANLDIEDKRGKTALIYAIEGRQVDSIRFLVDHKADRDSAILRINMLLTKIDVDLDPRSGFKGNSEMLNAEKEYLKGILEILKPAPPAASSSLLPGGGGGSNRKTRKRGNRKSRKSNSRSFKNWEYS